MTALWAAAPWSRAGRGRMASLGCVVAAALLVWVNTFDNGFHYDDEHSIVNNIHLRDLSRVPEFFTDPGTFSVLPGREMFRPLLVTTFALNYAAGGFDVTGYHAVNIAVHGANAALLWWLVGLLGGGPAARLLAGMAFAVHPVCSEPVNYISSRSDSLAAFFCLLALCLFLRSERAGQRPAGRRRACLRAGVWLAMGAGLLTKESVITLPAALVLLDLSVLTAGGRRGSAASAFWRRVLERKWFWSAGAGVAAGYLAVVTAIGWLPRSLTQPVRSASGWQALTQIKAAGYYLHLAAAPVGLNVEPQFAEATTWAAPAVWMPLLLLVSAGGGGAAWLWHARVAGRGRGRGGLFLFLLGWLALHVLPTSAVPLHVLVNERRAYLPIAILCAAVGLLLEPGLARRPAAARRWRGLGVAAIAVLAVLSLRRSQAWTDDLSLWQSAVARGPLMARSHLYLGVAHKDAALHSPDPQVQRRQWQLAAASFQRARELAEGPAPQSRSVAQVDLAQRALNNLGGVQFKLAELEPGAAAQHLQQAERAFRQAVALNPDYDDALVNVGNTALARVQWDADLGPGQRQQLLAEGIGYYERALKINPNHYQGYGNLGVAYQELGRFPEAEAAYRRALQLNPNDAGSCKNLAALRLQGARAAAAGGQTAEANRLAVEGVQMAQRALSLNPAIPGGRELVTALRQIADRR